MADFPTPRSPESRSKRETRRAAAPLAAKEGQKRGYFRAVRGKPAKLDPLRGPVSDSRYYGMAQNGGFGLF